MARGPALVVATAGGAGYAPVAPGTLGSVVGVILYVPLSVLQVPLYALSVLALLFVGIWAADESERIFQRKDDGRIVIDEVVGQLITLSPLLALSAAGAARSLWLLGAGFLLFRLFDILKPGPVGWAERRFSGGAGVMLDDVAAGALGALALCPLVWLSSATAVGGAS